MFKKIYYVTRSGRKPVEEYIFEQDKKVIGKILKSIQRLEEKGFLLIRPEAAKLRDKIYELRIKFSPNNFRIFYYFCTGGYVILLHAVKKKTDEVKARDIDTAESRMVEFEERIRIGEIKL